MYRWEPLWTPPLNNLPKPNAAPVKASAAPSVPGLYIKFGVVKTRE